MTIREATAADLVRMQDAAQEFYGSSRFLRDFELGRFATLWTALLGQETGVIYIVEDGDAIAGAIGGVVYPDAYSAALIATEFFWFIRPGSRGKGIELYRRFESWARRKGCREVRMVHLMDSMPEKVAHVYERLGFEAAEVHYRKELK